MDWEQPRLIWRTLGNYYLPQRVFTRRWLIPTVLMILFAIYLMLEVLTSARQAGTTANVWDIVTGVLDNRPWVHHGLTNFLVYLLSDIASLGAASQAILRRTGSRWAWFQTLVLCVITTVIAYLILLVIILFSITVTSIPLTLVWSSAAAPILMQQGLSTDALLTLAPLPTTAYMLTLFALAWIGIGVIVTIVTAKTQNAIYGFVSGLVLNYSAFIIWLSDLQLPLLDTFWFHARIFFWQNFKSADLLVNPFIYAVLYWLVWIALGLTVLWHVCRNLDIVATDQAR